MKKQCTNCKQTKDIERFSKQRTGADGVRSQCKSCQSNYNKFYVGLIKMLGRGKHG